MAILTGTFSSRIERLAKEPDISFDIEYKDQVVKIWIDGTDEWRDLKVTLKGFMPWWGEHEGVNRGADVIIEMLDKAQVLGIAEDYNYSIVLGGHSMGGALAVAVADKLWANNYKVKEVITYGAYGTGIQLGCKHSIYRNKYDLIPFIFPWWIKKAHVIKSPKESKWPLRFINAHKYYNKERWKKI